MAFDRRRPDAQKAILINDGKSYARAISLNVYGSSYRTFLVAGHAVCSAVKPRVPSSFAATCACFLVIRAPVINGPSAGPVT